MGTKVKSVFLVPTSSLVSGCARLFDWAGQYDHYNTSDNVDEADAKALFSDWASVGDDLMQAMSDYDKSHAA